MDVLRIGKISSIKYEDGTARILYTDRDNAVTAELPLLSFEYRTPEIDDYVLVAHLPNGAAAGIILGPFWNDNKRPPEGFQGLYRKDLDHENGKAMVRYDANTGKLLLVMPDTTLECPNTLILGDLKINGNLTVTGDITATGDVVAGGISLKNHIHTCPDGSTSAAQ